MADNVISIGTKFGRLRSLRNQRRRRLLLADLLDVEMFDLKENARLTAIHYAEAARLERAMSDLPVRTPDDLMVVLELLRDKTSAEEGAFPNIDAAKLLEAVRVFAVSLERGTAVA